MRKSILWLAVILLFAVVAMAGDSTKVEDKVIPESVEQVKNAAGDTAKAIDKTKSETVEQVKNAAGDTAKVVDKAKSEAGEQIKKAIGDSAKAGAKVEPETPGQTKKGTGDSTKVENKGKPEPQGQVKKGVSDSTKVEGKGKAETPGQIKKETGEKGTEGKAGAQKGTESKVPAQRSGFQIIDKVIGTGDLATKGDMVEVHYTGWLWENGKKGTQFDSSRDKGVPFSVKIGIGKVIKGWDEGIPGMKVGGTRELIIPPAMAYGARSIPGRIPPNSTLMFEVELLKVTKGQ